MASREKVRKADQEKKAYVKPEVEEHNTLNKARDCDRYTSGYNSDNDTYYH